MTAAQKPQKEKRERDRHSRATLIVPRREERKGVVAIYLVVYIYIYICVYIYIPPYVYMYLIPIVYVF